MKNVIRNYVIFNNVILLHALKSIFGLEGQSAGSKIKEDPWSWQFQKVAQAHFSSEGACHPRHLNTSAGVQCAH